MGVPLSRTSLAAMHLIAMLLSRTSLTGMHLMGMYLIGMHLKGVRLLQYQRWAQINRPLLWWLPGPHSGQFVEV